MQSANVLNLPIVVTEQNPKALGKTGKLNASQRSRPVVSELALENFKNVHKFEKMKFSMVLPGVEELFKKTNTKSVLLCGIEVLLTTEGSHTVVGTRLCSADYIRFVGARI
jgi:hypothetical protein